MKRRATSTVQDFDSERRLTPVEEVERMRTILRHMIEIDPERKGMRVRDVVASLYPPKPADGREHLRRAVEEITRTFPGREPSTVRLGALFSRMEDVVLEGGCKLRRGSKDAVGTSLWTAGIDAEARAPLSVVSADATNEGRPRRPYVDDPPACRQLIEREVGIWLCAQAPSFSSPPTGQLEAVSGSGAIALPTDLAVRPDCWVCVVYTKDVSQLHTPIGDRCTRIDVGVWNALGEARKNGANVYLSFCSDDDKGLLTFDTYDHLAWAPEAARTVDGNWLLLKTELLTSVAWFKQIVPHIQALRARTDASLGVLPEHSLSHLDQSLLRNDAELAAACQRGWLLTRTRPEDGITDVWRRRCEIARTADLYACVYSTGRGHVPGSLRGYVRLDLFPCSLTFSDPQVQALLDSLRPHLAEHEHQAIQPSPAFLAISCPGETAEIIGAILFEAVGRLRPKRLRPIALQHAPKAPQG